MLGMQMHAMLGRDMSHPQINGAVWGGSVVAEAAALLVVNMFVYKHTHTRLFGLKTW